MLANGMLIYAQNTRLNISKEVSFHGINTIINFRPTPGTDGSVSLNRYCCYFVLFCFLLRVSSVPRVISHTKKKRSQILLSSFT